MFFETLFSYLHVCLQLYSLDVYPPCYRQHQWDEMTNRTHSNLLDANNYKPFWISWEDNTIRVGRGYFYGQELLAEATDPNPRLITALGFSTGYQNSGQWQFDEDLGNILFTKMLNTVKHDASHIFISNTELNKIIINLLKYTAESH